MIVTALKYVTVNHTIKQFIRCDTNLHIGPKFHNMHSNMCNNDMEGNVPKSVTNNSDKFHIKHVFQLRNIELNLWRHFIWNFQDG